MKWLLDIFHRILAQDAPAPPRVRLPTRRESRIIEVRFVGRHGDHPPYQIGFSWDHARVIREAFCSPAGSTRSEMQDLIHDGCIAISRALQYGDRIVDLAECFGWHSLDIENQENCGPVSVFGAIALAGAALEAELLAEIRE